MWDARNIKTREIMELISSDMLAGANGGGDFIRRVCDSADKLRAVSEWVRLFFDEAFAREPMPDGATLAVFAPGSAARLEFWSRQGTAEGGRGSSTDEQSDLDILCVVDGWPANDRRRTRLMKEFADYLQYDIHKPSIPGAPANFATVWLDRMSKLPHGRFRDRASLIDTDATRIRHEDRRLEIWRYWIVFESALLYSHPDHASCAIDLERALATSFFGLEGDVIGKRFPLMWYHAASRYMSEIYLSTLRDIAQTSDPSSAIKKALTLKSVRVLSWSLAVINAVIVHELSFRGISLGESKWRMAKGAGLMPTLRLLDLLTRELDAPPGRNPTDAEIEQNKHIRKQVKKLEPLRDQLIDAYEKYFRWQEEGRPVPPDITNTDVWRFLHGKSTEVLPITRDMIDLASSVSSLFHGVIKQAGQVTGFEPDFLF